MGCSNSPTEMSNNYRNDESNDDVKMIIGKNNNEDKNKNINLNESMNSFNSNKRKNDPNNSFAEFKEEVKRAKNKKRSYKESVILDPEVQFERNKKEVNN